MDSNDFLYIGCLIVAIVSLCGSLGNAKNMVDCKTCGKKIAKSAKTCPHCGASTANKIAGDIVGGVVGGLIVWPLILGAIILIVILSALGNNKTSDYSATTKTKNQSTYSNNHSSNSITTTSKKTSDPSLITLAEFDQLEYGMTYQQCVNIIGSRGVVQSEMKLGTTEQIIYSWEGEGSYSYATLTFQDNELSTMVQLGLK